MRSLSSDTSPSFVFPGSSKLTLVHQELPAAKSLIKSACQQGLGNEYPLTTPPPHTHVDVLTQLKPLTSVMTPFPPVKGKLDRLHKNVEGFEGTLVTVGDRGTWK